MIKKAAAGLVSAFLITLGYVSNVFDNTDTSQPIWRSSEQFSVEEEEDDDDIEPYSSSFNLKSVISKYENFCIGGLNGKKLTTQEKYEAFIVGPCAPALVVPGILGTALQVQIDCQGLQDNFPTIFSKCGWSTCSSLNIFKKRPASEYRLWVGDVISSTSIFQLKKDSTCFGDLFSLVYDTKENKLINRQGIKATWVGNTPKTQDDSNCGANATINLSQNFFVKQFTCSVKGFKDLFKLLEAMGYQSGLTYQSVPYDFRQSSIQSDSQIQISQSIDNLFKLTQNKKVALIGHSLGGIQLLNALSNMSLKEKEMKVLEFTTIGTPFLGAPQSLMNLLGGDPQYIQKVLGKQIGLNFYSQRSIVLSCSSTFDLMPRDIFDFTEAKDTKWIQEILKRIDYEEANQAEPRVNKQVDYSFDIDLQDTHYATTQEQTFSSQQENPEDFAHEYIFDENAPFNFLPKPDDMCLKKGIFEERMSGKCVSGLKTLLNPFVVKIAGEGIKGSKQGLNDIVEKHSILNIEEGKKLKEKSDLAKEIRELKNPQVPITVIYGNHLPTVVGLEYVNSTRDQFQKTNDFYFPEKREIGLGDGTVPSYSVLAPALKWAFEELNNQEGAKRVRIIEHCSLFQGQPQKENNERSSYRGIDCQCQNGKSTNSCSHSCSPQDAFVLNHIASSLVETSQNKELPAKRKSENELKEIIKNCSSLQIKGK